MINHGADLRFAALQAAYAAEQMRKAFEVARLFQHPAAHHGREAQHLGIWLAMARDQVGEAPDDPLIQGGARIDAIGAHRLEQRRGQFVERIGEFNRGLDCDIHAVAS